jgi:hypothetical protein
MRIRKFSLSALILVGLTQIPQSFALSEPFGLFPSSKGTVFPENNALALLQQCRPVPHAQGTWLPLPDQIRELESRIEDPFRSARKAWLKDISRIMKKDLSAFPESHEPYYRQYGGLIVGGRKIIYVNAFHKPREWASVGPPAQWHSQVVSICDGGSSFFGVSYDLQSKTFGHFEFGGTG